MANIATWEPFRSGADLARWDPFEDSMLEMLPAFFRPVTRRAAGFMPRMDVIDTENAYLMSVELPGVSKEAIQVGIYENNLTLTAELKDEKQAGDEASWLLRERGFGKISRSVMLPEAIDESASEAKFENGVLFLRLAKKRASETKRIAIH